MLQEKYHGCSVSRSPCGQKANSASSVLEATLCRPIGDTTFRQWIFPATENREIPW